MITFKQFIGLLIDLLFLTAACGIVSVVIYLVWYLVLTDSSWYAFLAVPATYIGWYGIYKFCNSFSKIFRR